MGRHFRCSDNYFDLNMGSSECRRVRPAEPQPQWARQPRRGHVNTDRQDPEHDEPEDNLQGGGDGNNDTTVERDTNTQSTQRQPISRNAYHIGGHDNSWFTVTHYNDGTTTTTRGRLPPLPTRTPSPLQPYDDITDSPTPTSPPPTPPQQPTTNPDRSHISAWAVNPNATRGDALPDEITLGNVRL